MKELFVTQATAIRGLSRTSGVLGHRLTTGANSYGWDAINRMTSMNANVYQYRADGMLVAKTVSGVATRYRYDGQMPKRSGGPEPKAYERSESGGMEDVSSSNAKVTRYGLGARGIDYMEQSQNGGPFGAGFPVYDAHGNMVATLARGANGTYSVGNQRSFDAWGCVRLGSGTGDPTGRYCANLGHKQDDESGLIYMRARYYEPTSGRFVSQDKDMDGQDWFVYASNNPACMSDFDGASPLIDFDKLYDAIWDIGFLAAFAGGEKELALEVKSGAGPYWSRIWAKAGQSGLITSVAIILGKTFKDTAIAGLKVAATRGEAFSAVLTAIMYAVTVATFIAMIDATCDRTIDAAFPFPGGGS